MRRNHVGDGIRLTELGDHRGAVFVQRLEQLSLKLFAYKKSELIKAARRLHPQYITMSIGPKHEGHCQWTMVLEYQSTFTRTQAVKAARADTKECPTIYYDRTPVTTEHPQRVRQGKRERTDEDTAQPMRSPGGHVIQQTLLWMLFNEGVDDEEIVRVIEQDFPDSRILVNPSTNLKAQRWRWREDAAHEREYGRRLL